jgi:hypothetical protein
MGVSEILRNATFVLLLCALCCESGSPPLPPPAATCAGVKQRLDCGFAGITADLVRRNERLRQGRGRGRDERETGYRRASSVLHIERIREKEITEEDDAHEKKERGKKRRIRKFSGSERKGIRYSCAFVSILTVSYSSHLV